MPSTDTIEEIDTGTRVSMRPPSKFNVVFYNDNSTTAEFVVLVLMSIFHKSFESATALTMQIHQNGRGIAGTYSLEIASQKRDETLAAARANAFPLRCEIEEST